jgi:hypothetical protein
VCCRWQAAGDFSEADIKIVDEFTLMVHSPDSDKKYKLHFGKSEENSMPWCECYDWQEYRWPCKHFCAVFRLVASHGWDQMSSAYRDSPYFLIDEEVVTPDAALKESTFNDYKESSDNNFLSVDATVHENEEQGESATSCVRMASNCREALRTLNDLTFLCTNVANLQKLNEQLNELAVSFRGLLPQDGGLLLELPVKRKKAHKKSVSFAEDTPADGFLDLRGIQKVVRRSSKKPRLNRRARSSTKKGNSLQLVIAFAGTVLQHFIIFFWIKKHKSCEQ